MTRRVVAVATGASLLAIVVPVVATAPFSQAANAGDPVALTWAQETSGLAAADEYRAGTYIATDYVFDDHGANTDDSAGGDATYPSDGAPYHRNAADLVEVRVRPMAASGLMAVGVRLNTLDDPAVPVVAIGFDVGDLPDTALPWPGGAGLSANGVHYVVTLRSGEGTVTDLVTGTTTVVPVTVENNTPAGRRQLENTLTALVPTTAVGGIPRFGDPSVWRLHAAAGIRDGATWRAPGAYDAAFVTGEEFANWQQNRQAELLRDGDLSEATGELHFDRFPDYQPPTATGRQTRIYRPSLELVTGEGVRSNDVAVVNGVDDVKAPTQNFYAGLYLPYAVWVPHDYATTASRLAVFLEMHGASGTHLGLDAWNSGIIDVHALALAPLGRGELTIYKGAAELDVLEAIDDVQRHYRADPDRVFASGISMGGTGTYQIAGHFPDRFAAAIPIIGTGATTLSTPYPLHLEAVAPVREGHREYPLNSYGRELLDNFVNLPLRIYVGGPTDPVISPAYTEGDRARVRELGYDYEHYMFLERGHDAIPELMNVLFHQVLDGCAGEPPACAPGSAGDGFVRDANPPRVVYKTIPYYEYPELGILHRGAYWVSGLEVRDTSSEKAVGMIDVRSKALAHKERGEVARSDRSTGTFGPTGDPYLFETVMWGPKPMTTSNAFDATLTNLAAIRLDLHRMGIKDTSFTAVIAGDGPSAVTLLGSFKAGQRITVLRNGLPHPDVQVTNGAVILRGVFAEPATFTVKMR